VAVLCIYTPTIPFDFFFLNVLLENTKQFSYSLKNIGGPEKGSLLVYLLLVDLVTAVISSLTVCLANSPGNRR
jgi:hypothetical protein